MDYQTNKAGLCALYAQNGDMNEENEVYAGIGEALENKKKKAIAAKSSVEERMLRDLNQYNGDNTNSYLPETKNKPLDGRSNQDNPPVIHLTRQRTDAVAAKIINMLVPSNERAWSMGPTPKPELSKMVGDDAPAEDVQGQQIPGEGGEPVTKAEIADKIKKKAEEKSTAMRSEIDDQFKETHLGAKARRGIHMACKVGTAIFSGPVMIGKTAVIRNRVDGPEGPMWVKEVVEDTAPGLDTVDPFNFYPQPGVETIEKCEWAFEHQFMNRTEVRSLAKLPGFDADKLRVLLKQDVDHGTLKPNLTLRVGIDGDNTPFKDRYSMWKYVGPLSTDDLSSIGAYEMDDEEDELESDKMCEAWVSQGIVVKVKLSPMEETTRLPYYIFNYKRSDNSLWGYGIPYECQDSTRVVDSTWHIALHNAALSSGPQIVRIEGAVKPVDGDYNITGGVKQWKVDDAELFEKYKGEVFQVHTIEARVDELMKIHELAVEYVDQEIGFPLIAQGEPTEAVPTASGLAMLMNAQTVVQRGVAQLWDDDVMVPMVEAFYDWNMAYNENQDIKGDYEIVAYGATRLVQRDLQAQHLMAIANLTDNPRFAPLIKDSDLLEQIIKTSEIDVDTVLKTSEEREAEAENQQPNPMEQAQLREAEAKAAKAELELQGAQGGEQGPAPMSEHDRAHVELEWAKLDSQNKETEGRLLGAQLDRDAAAIKAASEQEITVAKLDSEFSIKTRDQEIKEFLGGMDARLKGEDMAMKRENMNKGFDVEFPSA